MMWNADVWNEMERLRREMNSLFSGVESPGRAATYPLVNVYDGRDSLVVTAELPGMTKEKVGITYSDGVLTIAGNLEPLADIKDMAVIRQERSAGKFEKSLRLPAKVDQSKITASFTNGILTVTLPKAEEAKPRTIAIEAK
jgi:HSP20 family protein